MRTVFLALAILIASASAWPQSKSAVVESNSRDFVVNVIVTLIEEYGRLVRDRGLDPYRLEYISGEYVAPVDGLFSASGSVSGVTLDGISEVAINSLAFDSGSGVLSLDLSYPEASGSVSAASGEVNILDFNLAGEAGASSLKISGFGFAGTATLKVDGGIKLDSFIVVARVGSIESNLKLNLLGHDVSDAVNNFLSATLPEALVTYEEELTVLFDYFVRYFLNRIL